MSKTQNKIAVVVPCYKVKDHIKKVLDDMPTSVWRIYCVDDACPDKTGAYIAKIITDKRIKIIKHKQNLGVGGAVVSGYKAALEDGADIIVKIDGDGQMDPSLIPQFVGPIVENDADYTKGNRFFNI